MIAKDKPIEASDLDNSLISIERTVTRTNTKTEPSGDQYSYKAKLIETRSPTSSGEGSPVLYTTSNIQDSGGVFSNSTESGPSKDLVTFSDFKSSVITKASSSHNHSLSDVREFAGWSITQNSSKDIVLDVYSPTTWTAITNSTFGSSTIGGICYGNGKFVAVGASGKIAYSSDGINWTAANSPTTENLSEVCYGNGRYVAAGANGKVIFSADGVNWTLISDSEFGTCNFGSICYGNGWYMIVGSQGKIIYSKDLRNWTVPDSKFGSAIINGVCYGNGNFVAVGLNGTIAYSSDVYHWNLATSAVTAVFVNVCYGNGKFMASGSEGKIVLSELGCGWVAVPDSKFGSSYVTRICYGNGKFVAVGESGKIAYSSNGVSWTLVSDSKFGTSEIDGICYGNGKFVAVGAGGKIAYSEVCH